jgi:hypothetical protein
MCKKESEAPEPILEEKRKIVQKAKTFRNTALRLPLCWVTETPIYVTTRKWKGTKLMKKQ